MIFTKMQGAGNDFVLLKPESSKLKWSELARKMCDRRFGIGADGIILALPSRVADVRMRMFNPDGSEAESCGNGLRCLAKYTLLNGLLKPGSSQMTIETIPGVRKVNLGYQDSELTEIQVGVGVPIFAVDDIPVKIETPHKNSPILDYPLTIGGEKVYLNFVSMGNPHAVFFLNQAVAEYPLLQIGPQVEHNSIFPKRINFEIANIIDRKTVRMRVWERGAGETLACGTGACAVAVAARLHQYTDNVVDIILPGGTLKIAWDGRGEVMMSGPAEVVFSGEWPE
jgi:diaminopimelate epimerase